MPPAADSTDSRARRYVEARGMRLIRPLGAGYDGSVFETNASTAVKLFRFAELYERERDVYLRLYEREMFEVCGCRIPRLVDYDNALWVVEMEIVRPPFVLDFAGAYLDRRPDYPWNVLDEWEAEKAVWRGLADRASHHGDVGGHWHLSRRRETGEHHVALTAAPVPFRQRRARLSFDRCARSREIPCSLRSPKRLFCGWLTSARAAGW